MKYNNFFDKTEIYTFFQTDLLKIWFHILKCSCLIAIRTFLHTNLILNLYFYELAVYQI